MDWGSKIVLVRLVESNTLEEFLMAFVQLTMRWELAWSWGYKEGTQLWPMAFWPDQETSLRGLDDIFSDQSITNLRL
jgi:hypothetical protein